MIPKLKHLENLVSLNIEEGNNRTQIFEELPNLFLLNDRDCFNEQISLSDSELLEWHSDEEQESLDYLSSKSSCSDSYSFDSDEESEEESEEENEESESDKKFKTN